jgi:RimJ/RimL family protein N-acetyltransferase
MMSGRLVTLRPVEEGDLDFLAVLANDPRVRSMVVSWAWPVASTRQQGWLAGIAKDPRSMRLTILDKRSQAPIGLTGLWEVDWHNGSAMTAIKLMPGISPKGAGSDAIMLVNAWAFYEVGLRRLHSTILDFNGPSIGAYVRRCGWRIEGCEKLSVFRRGEWCDLYHVALLRSDFVDLKAAAEYVRYVCDIDLTDKVAVTVGDWRPGHEGPMPRTRLGIPVQ